MARLPYIDGDKGNWGQILNTWLKHVAGYRGTAPARSANGNLPAGVAINGNGYGTNDQYQSDHSGLNFHNDFPANAPTGFTFIHTVHNRIYRRENDGWAVLLEAGGGSSQHGQDSDWYEAGTTNPPNNINDDIFTGGNVAIGKLAPASGVRLDINGKTATDTIQIKGPSAGANKVLVSNDSAGNAVWRNTSELLGTLTVQPISNSSSVITINPSTFNPSSNTVQTIGIGLTGRQPNQVIYRSSDQNNPYQWGNSENLIPRGSLVDGNLVAFAGDPNNRLIGSGILTIHAVSQVLSTASLQNGARIDLSSNGGNISSINGTATQMVRNNEGAIQINITDVTDRILQRGSLVAGNQINLSENANNRLIGSGDIAITHEAIHTTRLASPGTIPVVTDLGVENGHVFSIRSTGISAGNGISITNNNGT